MYNEKQDEPVREYLGYLGRVRRMRNLSLWELHQLEISREVARNYGLTATQIKRLDEDL